MQARLTRLVIGLSLLGALALPSAALAAKSPSQQPDRCTEVHAPGKGPRLNQSGEHGSTPVNKPGVCD